MPTKQATSDGVAKPRRRKKATPTNGAAKSTPIPQITSVKPVQVAAKAPETPKKPTRRTRIGITLDPTDLARIDALRGTVADSEAAREFGVEVDRSLVLRIAVIRGLAVMEAGAAVPRRPNMGANSAETPQKEGKSGAEPAPAPDEDVKRDGNGYIVPPDGWNVMKPAEKLPEGQDAVHKYYTDKGWKRYWGKAGDENIVFYWTGDERLHEIEPFPETSSEGKTVLKQKTPYGPGHLIPHGW